MANAGAVAGGALGGAGTGAAIGSVVPGIGTVIGAGGGALIGGLSGLFSSNAEENNRKMQMLMRAADQRAAPYLAKAGVSTQVTPFALAQNHGGDALNGALAGFGAYQSGQNAQSENDYRDAMKKLMLNQAGQSGLNASAGGGGNAGMLDLALQRMAANQGVS